MIKLGMDRLWDFCICDSVYQLVVVKFAYKTSMKMDSYGLLHCNQQHNTCGFPSLVTVPLLITQPVNSRQILQALL